MLVRRAPPDALIVDAVVFAFVMLMAGGHIASYSAHPFTAVAGTLCLTVPITVEDAVQAPVMRLDMDKAKKLLPALQRAALALSRIDADTEGDARAQA